MKRVNSSSSNSPAFSSTSPHMLACLPRYHSARSIPLGILQLLEPVEAHRLDDPAVDHDEARFLVGIGIEMLVPAVGGDVDEIALLPVITLGLARPFEFHRFVHVEAHVPVQVVTLALDHVDDLFGQVAMLAGGLPG